MATEEILELPCSVTRGQNGLSFDIGGSLIKLAFCRSNTETGVAQIVFRTFPLSDLNEAVTYILERHADLLEEGATVLCSGVGMGDRAETVQDKLKLKLKTVSELDCFVEAFSCMYENLPRAKMAHAESAVGRAYLLRQQAEWAAMIEGRKVVIEDEEKEGWKPKLPEVPPSPTYRPQSTYPVLLAILGSGYGAFRIDGPNKYQFVDPGTSSGRTFLGLGSLLTGAKTFEELVDLAERGDSDHVQVACKHVKTTKKGDMYSVMPDNMPLYCFGQAVGKDIEDFSKEDLAAAVLSTISQDLAQAVFLSAQNQKAGAVFFCGSFCGLSQVVRDEVSKYFMGRAANAKMDCGFMRYGGYLGALGALLRTLVAKEEQKTA